MSLGWLTSDLEVGWFVGWLVWFELPLLRGFGFGWVENN